MTFETKLSIRRVSASSLMVEGRAGVQQADPGRCSLAALDVLSHAAGDTARLTSLALEVASHQLPLGGEVELRTAIDKRTATIVFASTEAWIGSQLVFSAQALFAGANAQD